MPEKSTTSLQGYLSGLFNSFASNRTNQLEPAWRDAYDAFHRICDSSKVWKAGEAEKWRSDAYLGATRQKVIAAAAIVVDTMLQGGRINYLLETSPMAKEALEMAGLPETFYEDNKEKMQALIDEQLAWAQADQAFRKGVLSAALYGDTYAKLVLDEKTKESFRMVQETINPDSPESLRFVHTQSSRVYPKWSFISTWDVFTELENPDIRTNLGVYHRSFTRDSDLQAMAEAGLGGGFIDGAVSKVVKETQAESQDTTATTAPKYDSIARTYHNLRVLDFYGKVKVKTLQKFLQDSAPDLLETFEFPEGDDLTEYSEIEAHIMLAGSNNSIIRVNPVDEVLGRPIFQTKWEDDGIDALKATSVADNCMNTQHLLNGVFRALMDNQKLSGNSMLGLKQECLMEDVKELSPGATFNVSPECDDVRKAIQGVTIPDVSNGLLNTLQVVDKYLEEDSNIPRIQQGLEGARAQTAFGDAQRLEKSGKYFGQVVRNFDDGLIEPIIGFLYKYNMLDPEVLEGKGDYEVQALGFSSFQNRITRLNGMRQFLEIALSHPELFSHLKIEQLFGEMARLLDLDPEQVTFSKEELVEKQQQEAAAAAEAQEDARLDRESKEANIKAMNSQALVNTAAAHKSGEDTKLKQVELIQDVNNQSQKQ